MPAIVTSDGSLQIINFSIYISILALNSIYALDCYFLYLWNRSNDQCKTQFSTKVNKIAQQKALVIVVYRLKLISEI
jgi:hypothetical protein